MRIVNSCDLGLQNTKKLKIEKFNKAATYVKNARQEPFTHLKIILASDEDVCKTTSLIERVMRELTRRFKIIVHNWRRPEYFPHEMGH